MPRSCRRIGFAVSCFVGIAVAAPEANGQASSIASGLVVHRVYIDFVVPFTFRDLHPAIVEVIPDCQVGPVPPMVGRPFHKSGSNIIGETRVRNMNKSADGGYSVTLTEQVEVDAVGTPGGTAVPFSCTVLGKSVSGTTRTLDQNVRTVPPWKLAPGSIDKVTGQFTF